MTQRCAFAVLLVLLPFPALAGSPSFDCATAKGPAEKAICASAALSALDVKIADAYGRVRAGLTGPGRDALRKNQLLFLDVRDQAATQKDADLAALLGEQLAFLRTIDTRPRSGVGGVWRNAFGAVTVATKGGVTRAAIATAEPQTGRWVCEVAGEIGPTATGLVVKLDPNTADGWSLRLAPHDGLLRVVALAPKPGVVEPPFCGMAGTVEGDYLPVVE
ncbi:MAG: hypothetical protein LWW93_02115 [Hyphomicrobiales bacterium]|nr:hypothetical protein [Hyphomicrobiales bacterium]